MEANNNSTTSATPSALLAPVQRAANPTRNMNLCTYLLVHRDHVWTEPSASASAQAGLMTAYSILTSQLPPMAAADWWAGYLLAQDLIRCLRRLLFTVGPPQSRL